MQPKEPEKLNDMGERTKLFYWQKHALVCCFCFRMNIRNILFFPKKRKMNRPCWVGKCIILLANGKIRLYTIWILSEILISLGPGQNQLFVARWRGPRLWIIRVWKIPPLTATLRILFIAGPLQCYPYVDLVIGLSVIIQYEGLGISNIFNKTTVFDQKHVKPNA